MALYKRDHSKRSPFKDVEVFARFVFEWYLTCWKLQCSHLHFALGNSHGGFIHRFEVQQLNGLTPLRRLLTRRGAGIHRDPDDLSWTLNGGFSWPGTMWTYIFRSNAILTVYTQISRFFWNMVPQKILLTPYQPLHQFSPSVTLGSRDTDTALRRSLRPWNWWFPTKIHHHSWWWSRLGCFYLKIEHCLVDMTKAESPCFTVDSRSSKIAQTVSTFWMISSSSIPNKYRIQQTTNDFCVYWHSKFKLSCCKPCCHWMQCPQAEMLELYPITWHTEAGDLNGSIPLTLLWRFPTCGKCRWISHSVFLIATWTILHYFNPHLCCSDPLFTVKFHHILDWKSRFLHFCF